jgi:low affinity Fe/Cu permease
MEHRLKKTALAVTHWVGSPQSIVLHTLVFVASFAAAWIGFIDTDRMLLVLTTLVSLEAIYLAIFIQMTINIQGEAIEEVEQDIDEIQEDIDEIQEDVEEMSAEDEAEEAREVAEQKTLEEIRAGLGRLMQDVEKLQHRQ